MPWWDLKQAVYTGKAFIIANSKSILQRQVAEIPRQWSYYYFTLEQLIVDCNSCCQVWSNQLLFYNYCFTGRKFWIFLALNKLNHLLKTAICIYLGFLSNNKICLMVWEIRKGPILCHSTVRVYTDIQRYTVFVQSDLKPFFFALNHQKRIKKNLHHLALHLTNLNIQKIYILKNLSFLVPDVLVTKKRIRYH